MKTEIAFTPTAQARITTLLAQHVKAEYQPEVVLDVWFKEIFAATTKGTGRDFEIESRLTKSGVPVLITLSDADYYWAECE